MAANDNGKISGIITFLGCFDIFYFTFSAMIQGHFIDDEVSECSNLSLKSETENTTRYVNLKI